MSTKLTLTIDEAVITQAKQYAAAQGRSLSNLIEEYLKSLTAKSPKAPEEIHPIVDALWGSIHSETPIDDYKKLLADEIQRKHLKNRAS
jgi:hypothetical protein